MCEAVNYIHSKDITHGDLKPENVFLEQEKPRIKVVLGDFGLASKSDAKVYDTFCDDSDVESSILYTCVQSEPRGPASDIYALGIVLFELFSTFKTSMERNIVLSRVREFGRLPVDFTDRFPAVSCLIEQCVRLDFQARITARDILRQDILSDEYRARLAAKEFENVAASLPSHLPVSLYFKNKPSKRVDRLRPSHISFL